MRKFIFKILLLAIVLVIAAAVLVGCSESYKQAAITGGVASANVSSNSGLAVAQGNHLYFINGVEEATKNNAFGSVLKGSIMRVDLDGSGDPVLGTEVVIVPKIAYDTFTEGTNKTRRGITVSGEWIYYTTPNVEKGKTGTALSSELVLMRTKINGLDTQVIKNFGKAGFDYVIAGGYCVYYDAGTLYSINLNTKKFQETEIDSNITGYVMCPSPVNSGLSDVVFYTKAEENVSAYSNRVFSARSSGADKKEVISIDSYSTETLADNPLGYKITLIGYGFTGDYTKINLFYNKTVNSESQANVGTYSYVFDSAMTFDEDKETVYSKLSNSTKVTVISDDCVILYEKDSIVYERTGDYTFKATENKLPASTTNLFSKKIGNTTYLYYLVSDVLYRKAITVTEGDTTEVAKSNIEYVYTGKMTNTWLAPDILGDNIYFFNADRYNYVSYIDINAEIETPTKGIEDYKELGKKTQADLDSIKADEEKKAEEEKK